MTRPLPAIGKPSRLPALQLASTRLSNGLDVFIVERPGIHVVDMQFVIKQGAEADAPAVAGRTSLTAEMIDEGTGTRSALEIAEQLDQLGAHLEVQAGWDSLVASLHVLIPRLEPALDIFSDVLINAAFPEIEFRRKREERLGALRQEADEAAIIAAKTLARSVFGEAHPYGAPLNGSVPTVSSLTVRDVARVYEETFSAANAFVIVVGDVDASAMVEILEERLARIPASRPSQARSAHIDARDEAAFLLVHKPAAAQAELRVGFQGPARATPDYFQLLVMNTMLGGSFTSRLNMILREQMGVTYGARSRFAFRRNGGMFSAGAAVFSEAAVRSAEVIVEEMTRMAETPVPEGELRRAQSYLALGLPRQFETTEDIAAHLREQILYHLPQDYWQEYVDRIFAVSAEDVRAAAARHLHTSASKIVVVADRNDIEPSLQHTTWNKSIQLM